jgi:hypothetical protein
MEADRIALAIFGSVKDLLCDQLMRFVGAREMPKRRTSLIEREPHDADRLVVETCTLDRNDIHLHLQ